MISKIGEAPLGLILLLGMTPLLHAEPVARAKETRVAAVAVVLACGAPHLGSAAEPISEPIDVGSRRELFVDDHLIESLRGARRQLHHPTPREIAIVLDAPWEGAGSGYCSVIHDGDVYRLYYRGSALGVENGRLKVGRQVYCKIKLLRSCPENPL